MQVNNVNSGMTFQAKWNCETRRAINNGILTEVRKISDINESMKEFDRLSEKYDRLFDLLAEKFPEGKFCLHNQLGTSPKVEQLSFWTKDSYKAFQLPEEIQKEIKVVDRSNFLWDKFVIKEFPAKRLDWLYDFISNLKV